MKLESDRIVLVLHDDKSTFKNKGRFPVQAFDHRLRNLQLSGYVREIFACTKADPSPIFSRAISMYDPKIYMRGDDWPDFPGKSVIELANIPIKLVEYTIGISTTKIRGELKRR
jgi:glycerol-3-phosphate cytidylyltransferase-like family protein